jgi:hypothetical protein
MNMNKKSQIRMTETIAVIFVFFVLVLFGLIFYAQISKGVAEDKYVEQLGDRAVSVALTAAFLPELRCGESTTSAARDCVDLYKLKHTKQLMGDQSDYYFDLFGNARITVVELPSSTHLPYFCEMRGSSNSQTGLILARDGCVLYDMPKEGATRIITTPIPISILNPLNDNLQPEFYFGVLYVDVYT